MNSQKTATPLSLLLLGATGAVGQQVLSAALADARIANVIAPTRRPLPPHPKLTNPVIDFADLPDDSPWWKVDAVICALGTTLKLAGSKAAFATIDRDLPIQIAKLARQAGATSLALNSSLGAHPAGNFYLRTKAQAEAGIRALGYACYTIVRPSIIDAVRPELRLGEVLGLSLAKLSRPLIPRRYRAVKAARIASALLEGVLRQEVGEWIVESAQLQD